MLGPRRRRIEGSQPREGIEPPRNGSAVRRINHSATLARPHREEPTD
jgi:hypothetical protein